MHGHVHEVLNTTRHHLAHQIDLATSTLSQSQRELTRGVVGVLMAELSWKSDTNPKGEKRWELPKVPVEVAAKLASTAAQFSKELGERPSEQFSDLLTSPRLRRIAAETRVAVMNHLESRAKGH